jgi:Skp family chaperone for outer membrane proteins
MFGIRNYLLTLFAVLLASSALAQSPPGTPRKFATIKSLDFLDPDHRDKIPALAAASAALQREFAPTDNELRTLAGRAAAIASEYKTMQTSNADSAALKAKSDEYERLRRTIQFKEEEALKAFAKRRQVVLGPTQQKIGEAMLVYLTAKGYTDVVDMDDPNAGEAPPGTPDETSAFAAWYNAQPKN